MTVAELIEELKTCNQDLRAYLLVKIKERVGRAEMRIIELNDSVLLDATKALEEDFKDDSE
jgi:hypothetical protein